MPYSVLVRLPTPAFECWDYQRRGDDMVPVSRNTRGKHSDVFFWRTLLGLDPKPEVRSVGMVTHVRHPLSEQWVLDKPCELSEW